MLPSPLLQSFLESEPQSYATASDDAKFYELPARMLLMICDELNDAGFDLPALWPGDHLELEFANVGVITLIAATVH